MPIDGIEIDMMSVGDADAILVTGWTAGVTSRVLIDGGNKSDAQKVFSKLDDLGIRHLDAVVNSHPHDDHAGGLIEVVSHPNLSIGRVWIHNPYEFVNQVATGARLVFNEAIGNGYAKVLRESWETSNAILAACSRRGIPVSSPFAGAEIGPLTVVGPTRAYYAELISTIFADGGLPTLGQSFITENANDILDEHEEEVDETSSVLEDNPETEPINNTSVLLATILGNKVYLFTADAGAHAIACAIDQYPQLNNLHWLQLPHHGSRRNITLGLIDALQPKVAYVSAGGGAKHPRRAVVNAVKAIGAGVYSTHYPKEGDLWHHQGTAPGRPTYVSAHGLWNAP